ncbi:MAG: BrxE family protein [Bacteroidota bacterium]
MNRYSTLFDLRLTVAYLGERSQYNWWASEFLGETGLDVLHTIFPRTAACAALQAACAAARRLHDHHIGKGRVYHIFRLPTEVEAALHQHLHDSSTPIVPPQHPDQALQRLQAMATDGVTPQNGPVLLQDVDLATLQSSARLAAHYFSAFTRQRPCYPYMVTV